MSDANLFVFLLLIISTQGDVSKNSPFYCYSEDPTRLWTGLGGIHNPYEPIRGQNINANVSTCSPSKIWMLGRHGSRFPSATELPEMIRIATERHGDIVTNYNQGRTSLCASDFELLQNWKFNPNATMDVEAHLTDSGWKEMVALAQRFQAAFPSLLPPTYSPNHYFFRSGQYQRMKYSLYAFTEGLFGVNGHENVHFEDIPEPDLFMRPFSNCLLYMNLIRVEQNAFIQGPEYQQMVMQVSAKLGFHNSNVLRDSEVGYLALLCRYEQTWNSNFDSPFCAAFSVANAQVAQYSQDLEWYHRIAYGNIAYRRLYENLMCFQLQDLLRFIQSNNPTDHKARIFNGHVSQFLILLHFEAFAGDAILTRHNFAQQIQRNWKSNEILPMAANLAVVRFDCADGDNDILFLWNEKPLQIHGCDANGLCKQSLILDRFSRYLNANCMEVYCTNY